MSLNDLLFAEAHLEEGIKKAPDVNQGQGAEIGSSGTSMKKN